MNRTLDLDETEISKHTDSMMKGIWCFSCVPLVFIDNQYISWSKLNHFQFSKR